MSSVIDNLWPARSGDHQVAIRVRNKLTTRWPLEAQTLYRQGFDYALSIRKYEDADRFSYRLKDLTTDMIYSNTHYTELILGPWSSGVCDAIDYLVFVADRDRL